MSSNATLVALEGLVLRLGLLSPKCFESLIVNLNYGDSDCLKMLISKGLGLAIIAGATCVKLPQIFKITKSGSATGISFVATLLELLAVTANGAYSFSKGTIHISRKHLYFHRNFFCQNKRISFSTLCTF